MKHERHERITTISLDFVNAYLLETDGLFVLIDTGLPMHYERLVKELEAAGCVPGKLRFIVITHGDLDHTGSAGRLREKYKVEIGMHPGDFAQAENGIMLNRRVRTFKYRVFMAFRKLMRKFAGTKMAVSKFKPDVAFTDGQTLDRYGTSSQVIDLPGHTPGSIAVLTPDGDLFAGDTFVNYNRPESAMIIENSAQLRTSLDKLAKMHIRRVYPGHGKPFLMSECKCL